MLWENVGGIILCTSYKHLEFYRIEASTMVKISWNAHPKTVKIWILYALTLSLLHSSIFVRPSYISMLKPLWIVIASAMSWGAQHWEGEGEWREWISDRANIFDHGCWFGITKTFFSLSREICMLIVWHDEKWIAYLFLLINLFF